MRANTRTALITLVLSGLFSVATYAQTTDPAEAATPLRYESAFSDYRAQSDAPLLPWKNLFTADGEFAEMTAAKAAATPTQLAQASNAAAPTSDTRGRIESINKQTNKVKLKHGPIPKFEMPGMTMVFRVQDPKLLDQIKVGDEVGVNMDRIGDDLVITGFQK